MAEIAHIWRSPKRRELMEELDTAQVFENEGVEGCAHRRGGKRNVLFVAAEDLESVGVPPGRVKENFTVRGADVMNWPVGQRLQIGDAEHGALLGRAPPPERAKARQQLAEVEWLHQVVVGSRVEPGDAVMNRIARGQHQDGRPDTISAQAPADLDAVDARERDVQDEHVVTARLRHPERVLAAARDVHRGPLLDEAAADQGRHLDVVLDYEQPHWADDDTGFMRVP